MKRLWESMRMVIMYLIGWRLLREKFHFNWKRDLSNSGKHPRIRKKWTPRTRGVRLDTEVFLHPGEVIHCSQSPGDLQGIQATGSEAGAWTAWPNGHGQHGFCEVVVRAPPSVHSTSSTHLPVSSPVSHTLPNPHSHHLTPPSPAWAVLTAYWQLPDSLPPLRPIHSLTKWSS